MQPSLTFGTSGLRAEMDAGFNRMNKLTVLQATQGLATYLLETDADAARSKGVVIGFDHRHYSRDFALVSAMVLMHKGILVHFYPELVHTPMVPFGVKMLKAAAGVMITASHNPKQDNGYKLYWDNACQVIGPHDKHIQKHIDNNQEPWTWDLENVLSHPLLRKLDETLIDQYFIQVQGLRSVFNPFSTLESKNLLPPLKTVYTAMHGVGYPFAKRVMKEFDLPDFVAVTEQIQPDPYFSTVKYPNPEEGAGALKLAIQTANKNGARIIFANDPDADRLAIAELQPDTQEWKIFNGNEIANVLAAYVWACRDINDSSKKYAFLASSVSSKFLKTMGATEGFTFDETMTGFKWLGNRALTLRQERYTVLLAYEEAIGYMVGDVVPDKDGVSAMGVLAEMAHRLYSSGNTIMDYLNDLYSRYGYFCAHNSYYICKDPVLVKKIFAEIRQGKVGSDIAEVGFKDWQDGSKYPTTIGKDLEITNVRDLTTAFDSSTPSFKAVLPSSSSSQMITFQISQKLAAGTTLKPMAAVLTLRTSGTEPKIKFYSEGRGELKYRQRVEQWLQESIDLIVRVLLRPSEHGLEAKHE